MPAFPSHVVLWIKYNMLSFNAFWKFLILRNSGWNFWGCKVWSRDFFGFWFLAPFDQPCHLKSRVPPWVPTLLASLSFSFFPFWPSFNLLTSLPFLPFAFFPFLLLPPQLDPWLFVASLSLPLSTSYPPPIPSCLISFVSSPVDFPTPLLSILSFLLFAFLPF